MKTPQASNCCSLSATRLLGGAERTESDCDAARAFDAPENESAFAGVCFFEGDDDDVFDGVEEGDEEA